MPKSESSSSRGGAGAPAPRSAAEIEVLAREAGPLARSDPGSLAKRLAEVSLRDQAEVALRLPARERLEILLHSPAPMKLVRALPDFEVYLTVREVGPGDALPLLALASASQLVHLVDLEAWRGDRFDAARAGAWVALLLEAGEPAVLRFLRSSDDEVLVLLFATWAGIEPIVPEDGPDSQGTGETESGTELGFVSPDGQHRFRPLISEHAAAVRRVAEILFHDRQERYRRIVWATESEILAEVEEEAWRWRQSRIEEHGFPPLEEALAVYAPPQGTEAAAEEFLPPDVQAAPAPRTALRVIGAGSVLTTAVDLLPPATREGVLLQLTSLANHLLVADSGDAGDPEAHRAAIEKAASFVGIALAARGVRDPSATAPVISRVPLKELFREGHERAASLRRRAFGLLREGWASAHPRALDLLDAPILPRVKALLGPRALHWDPSAAAGKEVREFRSLTEVEESRVALDVAEILGRVFVERLGLRVAAVLDETERVTGGPPRFSTLLLTALAWHAVRGEFRVEALPAEVTASFLEKVASKRTAPAGASSEAMDAFLARLVLEAGLGAREGAALRAFAVACLDRLAQQCGDLSPSIPPDPRFVSCLLLAR
jgi:hypothetical protein